MLESTLTWVLLNTLYAKAHSNSAMSHGTGNQVLVCIQSASELTSKVVPRLKTIVATKNAMSKWGGWSHSTIKPRENIFLHKKNLKKKKRI